MFMYLICKASLVLECIEAFLGVSAQSHKLSQRIHSSIVAEITMYGGVLYHNIPRNSGRIVQRKIFRKMKSSFYVVMCLAWLQAGSQAKLSLFGPGQAMGDSPARALAQLRAVESQSCQLRPQLWLCDHQPTCHYQQPLALVTINNDNDPTVIKDNLNTTPQAHVTTSPPHHHQQPPTTSLTTMCPTHLQAPAAIKTTTMTRAQDTSVSSSRYVFLCFYLFILLTITIYD